MTGFEVAEKVGTGVALASAGVAVTTEQIGLLAILCAGGGTVVAVVAWFHAIVEKKLKAHEAVEFQREDQRAELEKERHSSLMREIAHVRELVGIDDKLRALLVARAPPSEGA